jgi:hypothetical protein
LEKLATFFVPVYGVYRCHHCNWRGWLPRGSSSPAMRRMLIGFYTAVLIAAVAFGALVIVQNWPKPEYQYPVGKP